MDEGVGPGRWQDDLYDLLRRNNVTQFAYVPDAGHRILIDRSLADPEVHSVALTSEEEGVAMLAGADLGGARGVLLMQSSGTGNCVNMLSLIKGGRFPFLTLVSMRGDFGEGNPWQFPMGQAAQPVLEDFLIVSGLAGTSRDIAALTRDGAHTYTMAGAIGGACMIGLGLALARPDRRVLVLTGDSELLMNVGTLATIAVVDPANLAIVCVDNGHYGETGYQKSHASLGVDLEKIAAGSGIKATRTIASQEEIAEGARLIREG